MKFHQEIRFLWEKPFVQNLNFIYINQSRVSNRTSGDNRKKRHFFQGMLERAMNDSKHCHNISSLSL